ncbi:nuclear transport factor 2 family protein [Streptomyces sp. NPDC002523]
MSTPEERNLAAVGTWLDLYNTDVHRMIDESYAEDFRVIVPGILELDDKETFHSFEQKVLDAAPDRRCHIDRYITTGETVVVQASLSGTDRDTGKEWITYWCAILEFRDGLIVTDYTYLDPTTWPTVA